MPVQAVKPQVLVFETLSGRLSARVTRDEMIELDFPLNQPAEYTMMSQIELLLQAVLGANYQAPEHTCYSSSTKKLIVVLGQEGPSVLEKLAPDPNQLLSAHDGSIITGISVTSLSDDGEHDFISRYFAPWNGINEDPVNGSSHTVLGPYWAHKLGKRVLRAKQCSARGGTLELEVGEDRVKIKGQATTFMEGSIHIPTRWVEGLV